MLFKCSNCQKELNIPDDKLPSTPRFKVKCPHCQERVVLDRNAPQDQGIQLEMAPDLRHEQEFEEEQVKTPHVEPEIFPPGARIVFVALNSKRWIEESANFFQEMGYHESRARDVQEAVMKLRLNDYHVLLVEDTPQFASIIREIGLWPGIKRRKLNVVCIGEHAQSLDPRISFKMGINTYINVHETERGHDLFAMALKGYDEYYRYLQIAQGEA